MNTAASGKETERKAFAAKPQAETHSNSSCSFCWFVMKIYPTLNGMTLRDTATFREHLEKAHGLKEEISQ